MLLVLSRKWCGAEVKTHTCKKEHKQFILSCRDPANCGNLLYCLITFTCMSDSEQVTVCRLGFVNHRDLNDGLEDRTINCPTKTEEF